MSWEVPLPSGAGEHLLWAQTSLVWMAAAYVGTSEPVGRQALGELTPEAQTEWIRRTLMRGTAAAAVCWLLPGLTLQAWGSRLLMATAVLLAIVGLPAGRLVLATNRRLNSVSLLAEWEIIANIGLISFVGAVIGSSGASIYRPLVVLPLSTGSFIAVLVVLASLILTCRGGTHVVRGVLDKAGAYPLAKKQHPPGKDAPSVDESEYNRGRTIGNLERILMSAMVAAGSLEALGLILAAKGLIRAKEFEDRDFAEYFIVGSLASVAVAMAVGAILHIVLPPLWAR